MFSSGPPVQGCARPDETGSCADRPSGPSSRRSAAGSFDIRSRLPDFYSVRSRMAFVLPGGFGASSGRGAGMPAAECLVSEGSDVEIKRCGSAGLFVRCVANRRLRSASFGVCSVGGGFGPRDTDALRMIGALLCQSAAGEGRVGRHRRDDAALRMGRLRAAALRLRPKSETFKTVFRLAEFAVRCAQTG